jgi:Cu-processing system permease protein
MFDHSTETALRWKRVRPMARKEFWEHVRNYWIGGITGLLLVLLVVTAYLDALAAGHRGFTDFQATISNNTHLILPLVAIIGLMMGYGAVSNEVERGSMNVLLAKPISKTEVLVGKFLGLGAVLTAAIVVGVLAASIIMIGVRPFYNLFTMPAMAHGGTQAAAGVITYLPFAVLYGLAFLAIGIFISTVARSRAQSIAGVIFVWFLFLIIWDAVLVGIKPVIASDPQALPNWYYAVELLNPVAVFRSISSRLVEANMQVLPPLEVWPGWFDLPVFFVMLVLYAVGPMAVSIWVFRRRDL